MRTKIFLCIGIGICSNLAQALTTSSSVAITVVVPASCTMSFNVPNLSLVLIPGYATSGSTNLTIGCTSGAVTSLGITSQNNWTLHGATHGANLSYTLVYSGGGQTTGATIPSSTWSGGVANRVVLTGTATINDWVIPLSVTTPVITNTNLADIYSDIVVFTITY